MAVVIQVDLRVCVLAVLVLVWVHWDIRSFQRDNVVALRKELKEIKETQMSSLSGRNRMEY